MNKDPIQQLLRCRNCMAPDENCQISTGPGSRSKAEIPSVILILDRRHPCLGNLPSALIQVLDSKMTSQLDIRIIEGAVITRKGRQKPNQRNN